MNPILVNCLSCKDTTYQKKIPYSYDSEGTTSVYAALEQKQALQIKKTIGPYRSYELDTLRKLSRNGQPIGTAIRNKEIHRRRISLEQEARSGRYRRMQRSCGGSHTSYQTRDDFSVSSVESGRPFSGRSNTQKHKKKYPAMKTKQAASMNELSVEEILLYSNNGTVYRGAK